jgi:hypothetical protein
LGWFRRRKETLNERLMREAGLDAAATAPKEPAPAPRRDRAELEESWFGERSVPLFERLSGEVTAARPRRWDAVVTAEAPEVRGQEVEFVALPDGSLIVDEERGEGDLTPLAEAVEAQVAAPYRASGVRRGDDVWVVGARRIQVASFRASGDELELSRHDGVRTLLVDGAQEFGTVPELEAMGQPQGESYAVRARRLDGDLWEVDVKPL